MAIVTSLPQPDGGERVVRMNKQRMFIVTSLTQPDGRERVVRMNNHEWPLSQPYLNLMEEKES